MVEVTTSLLIQTPPPNKTESDQLEASPTPSGPSQAQQRKPASKAEVLASVKAAREVIGQKNQPVQVSTLFQEISARGFIIDTPKPVITYGARLRDYRNRVDLKYLEGFGWWLAERPYPPANHIPSNVSRIGKHIV